MNGISGISNNMYWMQNMQGMQKPNPEEMAQQLFAELDTSGQGYLEKSDLQAALSKISSTSESSASSSEESDLDELFTQLDSDGNGKITEQELSESLAYIDDQVSNLFSQMRMNEAQQQMMPPPPPPQEAMEENDVGFTEEELIAQLEEIGQSDSARSTLIENILANFDEADTDGDGRVNLQEAMAFDQTNNTASNSAAETAHTVSSDEADTVSEKVMMQIMRLVQAYELASGSTNDNTSTLSVTT